MALFSPPRIWKSKAGARAGASQSRAQFEGGGVNPRDNTASNTALYTPEGGQRERERGRLLRPGQRVPVGYRNLQVEKCIICSLAFRGPKECPLVRSLPSYPDGGLVNAWFIRVSGDGVDFFSTQLREGIDGGGAVGGGGFLCAQPGFVEMLRGV